MTIGTCIKTGAVVLFEDYGQIYVADLFEVGDAIVINFTPDTWAKPLAFSHPRRITHLVTLSEGFLQKDKGVCVVLAKHLKDVP